MLKIKKIASSMLPKSAPNFSVQFQPIAIHDNAFNHKWHSFNEINYEEHLNECIRYKLFISLYISLIFIYKITSNLFLFYWNTDWKKIWMQFPLKSISNGKKKQTWMAIRDTKKKVKLKPIFLKPNCKQIRIFMTKD